MSPCDDLHLPPEICRDILIRLPVKSILRFRSVCRSWYSLVPCPNFISDHSNLNKDPNHVLLHLSCNGDDWEDQSCSFSSHDKSFMEAHREHHEIPESFREGGSSIVGSCNGLICLIKYRCNADYDKVIDLAIWNPTIRKIVELPSPICTQFSSWFGFGFDPKTNDYKILSCSLTDLPDMTPNITFQIFDLGKGVWRDISPRDPNLWHVVDDYADCYLDGAVHWSGFQLGFLLSFNFSNECFGEINLPDCAKLILSEDGSYIYTKCATFRGLIHVMVFWVRANDSNGSTDIDLSKRCSVWAMKEYGVIESWTRVSDIDLQSALVSPRIVLSPHRFLLWENGVVLMAHNFQVEDAKCREDLVVLYNSGNQNFKCIFSTTKRILGVCCYEESLVLM